MPQPAAQKTEAGEHRGAVKGSQLTENAVSSIKWMRQGAGALLAQLFILRAGEPRSDGDTEHWVPTGTQVGLKGWMFRGEHPALIVFNVWLHFRRIRDAAAALVRARGGV